MALLFSEGFDWPSATADLTQQYRDAGGGYVSLDATGSFRSGKCLKILGSVSSTSGMSGLWRELMQAPSGSVIRFYFRLKTNSWTGNAVTIGSTGWATAGESLLKLQSLNENGFGPCLSFGISSTGTFVVARASDNTNNGRIAQANSTAVVSDGNWHRIEVEITLATTATGSIKVWIDGSLDINSTSIITSALNAARGISLATTLGIGLGRNAGTTQTTWFDDIIVWDDSGAEFTGAFSGADIRIDTLKPSAAGDNAGFTPSAGANFAAVDDPFTSASDDDTTYVEASTAGTIDLHNYENYLTYPSTVYGITVKTRARITTNGRAQLRTKAKVATTTANGPIREVWTSQYIDYWVGFGKQPNGSAWDLSSLNAAQFGYERV